MIAREDREEALRKKEKACSELADSRRRLDRGTPQLAETRRKLQQAEEGLAKAGGEVAEERRARERCHAETIRMGEKLRVARSQSSQLREKVRVMEEIELRYPSRVRASDAGLLTPEADVYIGSMSAHPLHQPDYLGPESRAVTKDSHAPDRKASALTPSPPRSPRCFSNGPSCVRHDTPPREPGWVSSSLGDMNMVLDFVAREEQRLPPGSERLGRTDSGMFEEPRPSIPSQSEAPVLQHHKQSTVPGTNKPGTGLPAVGTDEAGLAALLAAEPRVLKLPAPLRSPATYYPLLMTLASV